MAVFAFYSQMPVLPLFLGNGLGMAERETALAMGVYTVSAVASRAICGYMLDSYGRRVVYLSSIVFFGGLFFLYIPAGGWAGMMVLRIVHGMAWGMVTASSQTSVVDSLPAPRRGEGIGIFGLSVALAIATGPAVGMWGMESFSYMKLFAAEGAICLVGLACALPVRYRPAPPVRPKFEFRNLLERTSLPISVMAFVLYMGFGAAINWISVHAQTIDGVSAGLFFAFMAAGTGFSRLVTGKIYDRRGPVGVSTIGFALFAASLFLLAAAPGPAAFCAGALLLGLGSGVFMPVSLAIINSLVGADRRGAANSTYYTFFDCGIGMGIIIAGELIPYIGLRGAFAVFGCAVLAAAAFFYLYAWPYSRRMQRAYAESA